VVGKMLTKQTKHQLLKVVQRKNTAINPAVERQLILKEVLFLCYIS
jgi:hypothetical protein